MTSSMGLGRKLGRTEPSLKDTMKMGKKMARATLNGAMGTPTKANLKTTTFMERGLTPGESSACTQETGSSIKWKEYDLFFFVLDSWSDRKASSSGRTGECTKENTKMTKSTGKFV